MHAVYEPPLWITQETSRANPDFHHGLLVLFRVVREGIGISQRLSATGTCAPTGDWDAHPRTQASPEPTSHHQRRSAEMEGLFTRDAQAACGFSFSASKLSPFFHRVSRSEERRVGKDW